MTNFNGNGGANDVASLRAQVAQLQQQLQMQGGGMGMGRNPFMGMMRPSMGMGMMGGMGMGGYYNAPYVQPQQGGRGLLGKVGSISVDGAGLNYNDLVEKAGRTRTKTIQVQKPGAEEGTMIPKEITVPTAEALQAQKVLGTDQASADAAASAQSTANTINGISAGVGAACAITGTVVNAVIQFKMADLQEKYMDKMESLAEKYMVLQERGMEINQEIMEGKQRTVVELAEIQAEVAKFQIKKSAEVSIQNTKTAAAYGWVGEQLYGTPKVPFGYQHNG